MSPVRCIFVYGTLMRDMRNHEVLQDLGARFEGPGWLSGRLFVSDFPRYVPGGDGRVFGEVYSFDDIDAAVRALDDFEGGSYVRTLVDVTMESRSMPAWAYASRVHGDGHGVIESGDLRKAHEP